VKVKRFLPHLQNERQLTVNDCWPSIIVNHSVMWQLLSIYIVFTVISKNHFRLDGMAASEWTCSVNAVRDTPVADYSAPGINTTRRVAYCPLIGISLFLLALLVFYFQQTHWRSGQL
jgi:hypothetical protein